MKIKLVAIICLLGLNQTFAQTKTKPTTFVQPKGFVFVPSTSTSSNSKTSFYVMAEPVTMKDFKDFTVYLITHNRLNEATICTNSVPKNIDPKAKYVLLASPQAIAIYADYLSKKLSDKTFIVKCTLISENNWKQMQGPDTGKLPKTKNPYGITYVKNLHEWKANAIGTPETYTDLNGNKSSGYRLMMTYIQK